MRTLRMSSNNVNPVCRFDSEEKLLELIWVIIDFYIHLDPFQIRLEIPPALVARIRYTRSLF